jgi:hypothetical protein
MLRLRRFAAMLSMNGPFPLVLSVAEQSRRMSGMLSERLPLSFLSYPCHGWQKHLTLAVTGTWGGVSSEYLPSSS